MPELPEVETVRAGLERTILHKTIATVDQRRADLRGRICASLFLKI
jgi:formamidopyrimidine-DNA glycosylase